MAVSFGGSFASIHGSIYIYEGITISLGHVLHWRLGIDGWTYGSCTFEYLGEVVAFFPSLFPLHFVMSFYSCHRYIH